MFIVRKGRENKGKGLYLSCEPKRGFDGQVLLGGGSQCFWQKKQKKATRFRTRQEAEQRAFRMWCGNDFRIVALTGRKAPPRAVRLERAGWSSALSEVTTALAQLRRAPDADACDYNAALDDVAHRVETLRKAT